MKRSEINHIMEEGIAFIVDEMGFLLPPFAYWSPEEWGRKGRECRELVGQQLGWDITDFGSSDFRQVGLILFTLRNGTPEDLEQGEGKVYAEKVMVVRGGQVTPTHFHYRKMEDIINRGGGVLVIQLWNSTREEDIDPEGSVTVSVDGTRTSIEAGGTVSLAPGQSICLHPKLNHKFWGDKGTVLVGEVSSVNDDRTDNRFHEPVGRFTRIEEDEEPLHLLCTDYVRCYGWA